LIVVRLSNRPPLFDIVNIHLLRGAHPRQQGSCVMAKDNALSFVGQIMTEHKLVLKADGEALRHAIECGKYLNLAKENVLSTKPKGKWTKWREENIPEISQQTASLYMRLAENEDQAAKCPSIRQADELLRALSSNSRSNTSDKSETDDDADEDEADNADETNNALLARKGVSPDLTTTLQNVDVDEVCTALISAWDEEHIRQLCDRLREHFTKPAQQAPNDLSIPSSLRRSIGPAPTH
jgi:hypothetical protein